MIVVAIVSILVAMAVPAYKNYAVRAKVTECINGAAIAKIQVSEYRQALGDWPATDAHAGLVSPSGDSKFCTGFSDYQGSTGAFTIDIDETMIGVLSGVVAPVYTPTQRDNGIIDWSCTRGSTTTTNVKLLPAPCRSSA